MEQFSEKKIILLLDYLSDLLKKNDENQWGQFLLNAKNNFIESNHKAEAVIPIMRSMTGGAGSLRDVVMYRDRKPLVVENTQLHQALLELYIECKKVRAL